MNRVHRLLLGCAAGMSVALAFGCKSKSAPATAEPAPAAQTAASLSAPAGPAQIGQLAPDFELPDLDGKPTRLRDHRGKVVVLEWFNPECPFVRASHTKGSLVGLAARHAKQGVVWLAINSSAPGKQGHEPSVNLEAKQSFQLAHPILRDETGRVGRAYGSERTPHLFVIDPDGKLVYAGAIDNSPDGERESPKGGQLVNYVDAALTALARGLPIAVPRTEPYGCTVKYGS
jgi:peroxiredoxin